MKKKLLILLIIACICFIPKAYAGSYNFLRVTTVFDGSGVPRNLEKIHLYYSTVTDDIEKSEHVVLNKADNFAIKIPVLSIDDVKFKYAVAITDNDYLDIYGFVKFTGNIEKDIFEEMVDLTLAGVLDNKKFDGEKYRGNSVLTDEEIENLRKGEYEKTTKVTSQTTNYPGESTTTTKKSTTTTTESTTTGPTGTQYIHDESVKTAEQKREELKKSGYTLLYVVLVILGIVAIIGIVMFVKMIKANHSV